MNAYTLFNRIGHDYVVIVTKWLLLTTAIGSDVDEFAINGSPFQLCRFEGRPYALPFHRQLKSTKQTGIHGVGRHSRVFAQCCTPDSHICE